MKEEIKKEIIDIIINIDNFKLLKKNKVYANWNSWDKNKELDNISSSLFYLQTFLWISNLHHLILASLL